MTTLLQEDYTFTRRLHYYKKTTLLQEDYTFTRRLHYYKKTTLLQEDYTFTRRLQPALQPADVNLDYFIQND